MDGRPVPQYRQKTYSAEFLVFIYTKKPGKKRTSKIIQKIMQTSRVDLHLLLTKSHYEGEGHVRVTITGLSSAIAPGRTSLLRTPSPSLSQHISGVAH